MPKDMERLDILTAIAELLVPPLEDMSAGLVRQHFGKKFLTVWEIADEIGQDPKQVGEVLADMMDWAMVTKSQRHGYRVDELVKAIERRWSALHDDFMLIC